MIYLGADHRGYELKEKAKQWLADLGYQHEDCGAFQYDKEDDYPDFAKAVAEKVANNAESRGVLICGSGIGIAIAANKVRGIRAGTAINAQQIHDSVNDENLNILVLSADHTSAEQAQAIIKIFLETRFSGEERHTRRISKMEDRSVADARS